MPGEMGHLEKMEENEENSNMFGRVICLVRRGLTKAIISHQVKAYSKCNNLFLVSTVCQISNQGLKMQHMRYKFDVTEKPKREMLHWSRLATQLVKSSLLLH